MSASHTIARQSCQQPRGIQISTVVNNNLCRKRCATPDTKNHPLDAAKKYVETYSSSNVVAQISEERAH